jgi:hypothetical protein
MGGAHKNTITITLYPKPRAVDYTMEVEESSAKGKKSTRTLYIGDNEYGKLSDSVFRKYGGVEIKRFSLDGENGGAQNGKVSLINLASGIVEYEHNLDGELKDSFNYWMYYECDGVGDDGVKAKSSLKDSSMATVRITALKREPLPLDKPVVYEDTNGNGIIDKATLFFDRGVIIKDTHINVTFGDSIDFTIYGGGGRIGEDDNASLGKDAEGNDIDSVIVLTFYENVSKSTSTMPVDSTSGEMIINVTHTKYFEGRTNEPITAKDGAAPVFKGEYAVYIESAYDKDTLVFEMSEKSDIPITGGNHPFRFTDTTGEKFFDGNKPVEFSFAGASALSYEKGGNRQYLVISPNRDGKDSVKIEKGDSVFINWQADDLVKDFPYENAQKIPENKRVAIIKKKVTSIRDSSVVYLDTGSLKGGKDGYIDLIKIDLGMNVSKKLAKDIGDNLTLSPKRNFTLISADSIANGIQLTVVEANRDRWVTQDGKKVRPDDAYAKTGVVDTLDYVFLDKDVFDDTITVQMTNKNIPITDSVAPVILYAHYIIDDKKTDTTLKVTFSEPTTSKGGLLSPYMFFDELPIPGGQYEMKFKDVPAQISPAVLQYKVSSVSIPYPMTDDSVRVELGNYFSDSLDNVQDYTVWAPLIVDNKYKNTVEVKIVPQPLILVNTGKGRQEPKKLDDELIKYYQLEDKPNRGIAIVVEIDGPISKTDLHKQRGAVKIIDQTGNLVNDVEMNFIEIKEGARKGSVVGVSVWDGKNTLGRTVGASTYLSLVEVEIQYEYKNSSPVPSSQRKIIAVTSSGNVLQ